MTDPSQYFLSPLVLTGNSQLHKQNDTNFEGDYIKNKMAEIVRSNTVVNPRAMAIQALVVRSIETYRDTY